MSLALGSILLTWLFNASAGSISAVALFHAALDIFIGSPVATAVPNVMGALLTLGTLLLNPNPSQIRIPNPARIPNPMILIPNTCGS
jgi:hypothetical protein